MLRNGNNAISREIVFYALAAVFFVSLIAFVIANFVFLAAHLNKAFGFTPQEQPQTIQFDGGAFDALRLVQ